MTNDAYMVYQILIFLMYIWLEFRLVDFLYEMEIYFWDGGSKYFEKCIY